MHKVKIVTSPEPLPITRVKGIVPKSVFLAGSIEQGGATDWQKIAIDRLVGANRADYVFNPRRKEWDATWEQSINNPVFVEQVEWELLALDIAEVIYMYFDPNTKSPISLLELGLYANTGKLQVCCPDGFWRKGNVDIICKRFNIRTISVKDFLEPEPSYDLRLE
jgi:hypothetical protein